MANEMLIVFGTCGFLLLLIVISSWYRRKKRAAKEPPGVNRIQETVINGQRTFRIATVSRQDDRLAVEVYEIRLPRVNDPMSTATITLVPPPSSRLNNNLARGQPPPPFSTAINMPSPSSNYSSGVAAFLTGNNNEESPVPPPRYDEIVTIATISGNKVPEDMSVSSVQANSTSSNNLSTTTQLV